MGSYGNGSKLLVLLVGWLNATHDQFSRPIRTPFLLHTYIIVLSRLSSHMISGCEMVLTCANITVSKRQQMSVLRTQVLAIVRDGAAWLTSGIKCQDWALKAACICIYIYIIEGSLEAKLPTIWTVETQSREEAERREKIRRKKR